MTQKWIYAALIDWTIVILAISSCYLSIWFLPIAFLIVGNRQHALAILGHDGAHKLVVQHNKKLNDFLTNLFAWYPLSICMEEYRRFHFDHHRHTNTENDPEIPLKEIGPFKIGGEFSKTKLLKHVLFDLVGFGIPQMLGFFYLIRARTFFGICQQMIAPIISLILIVYGFWLIPLIWYGSLYTAFWATNRARIWAEHVGLGKYETLSYKPTLLQRILFLPHNTWCHDVHHDHPGIPFSELPNKAKSTEGLCEVRMKDYNEIQKCKCGSFAGLFGEGLMISICCDKCDEYVMAVGEDIDIRKLWNEGQRGFIKIL